MMVLLESQPQMPPNYTKKFEIQQEKIDPTPKTLKNCILIVKLDVKRKVENSL